MRPRPLAPRWLHGRRSAVAAAVCGGSLWLSACPLLAVELALARQQFLKSCGTCHSATEGETNRQGPNLYGVIGRKAGSRPDFAYSEALRGGRWVWDEASLDRFITNAQEAHPGTIMTYAQSDPEKRALIIGFLQSELAGPKGAGQR